MSSKADTLGSSVNLSQTVDQAIANFNEIIKSPQKNSAFLGRKNNLDSTDNSLLSEHRMVANFHEGSLQYYGLCGMDHIGKTQVAVEYHAQEIKVQSHISHNCR